MQEMTGSGHHGPEVVDLPDTTLNESECKSPPTLEPLRCPSNSQDELNDTDLDLGCHGLTIATRIENDEKHEGQGDHHVDLTLLPEREAHGPDYDQDFTSVNERDNIDVGSPITPVDAGASSKGVMDGHDVEESLASVEAGASSKGVMDGPDGGNRITSVEAGASSKDVMQAGCRKGDTFASKLRADSRQMGGMMKPERRSDVDGHCPAPEREIDGCHVDGGAASEDRKSPHGGRGLQSGDRDDGSCCGLGHAIDDPIWVRVGRSSHDRWDPGGVRLIGFSPAA